MFDARKSLVGLLFLAATGCHSELHVRKVEPNDYVTPGIRYSLPKVVLRVEPKSDGSVAVTEEYLPDLDNTYAVDAKTTLGTHTFDMQLEKGGLLKKVTYNPNTAGVAEKVATLGGDVLGKIVDQRLEEEKTAKADAKEANKALKDKREALVTAVDTATKSLRSHEAQLASLQANGGTPETILSMRVQIDVDKAELAFVQQQLLAFDAGNPSAAGGNGRRTFASEEGKQKALAEKADAIAKATKDMAKKTYTVEGPCGIGGAGMPCGKDYVRGPLFLGVDEPRACPTDPVALTAAKYKSDGHEVPQPCFCSPPAPDLAVDSLTRAPRLASAVGTGGTIEFPSRGAIFAADAKAKAANEFYAAVKAKELEAGEIKKALLAVVTMEQAQTQERNRNSFELVASRPIVSVDQEATVEVDADKVRVKCVLLNSTRVAVILDPVPSVATYKLVVKFRYEVVENGEVANLGGEAALTLIVVAMPPPPPTPPPTPSTPPGGTPATPKDK